MFSTLDAAGAYHIIPVAKKTRPLLAFTTPFVLYQFKRLPFGMRNAVSCYSRFMDTLVSQLRTESIIVYLDDIIVATKDEAEHLRDLEKVLKLHRHAGIKLNAKKTHLFQEAVSYLGFRVSEEGIGMQSEYVDRILNWPTPKTTKQLQSWLGFVNYYRTFIQDFSVLTAEMNAQRREKTLNWTEVMEEKFKELKEKFRKSPIRAYPRYGEDEAPFEVWPDFSNQAIGHVLQQRQDGKLRLIAAGGRKTTPGETNYAPTKGELSAIVHALRTHEHILRYKPFVIMTDHQALKWLHSMKNPRGIFTRWLMELASYNFTVQHVPGKKTGAADGLSRSSHLPPPTQEEINEEEELIANIMYTRDGKGKKATMNWENIKIAQEEDDVLRLVKKWLRTGKKPAKEDVKGLNQDAWFYYRLLNILTLDDNDVIRIKGL